MVGEDVEDDRGAVDHRHADGLLQVPLLAGQQLVVAGHEVRARVRDRPLQVGQLALSEVAVRVGLRAPLDQLARHGHAGGPQELAQLGEIGLLRRHRDAQRPLPGARVADALAIPALSVPPVASPLHSSPV